MLLFWVWIIVCGGVCVIDRPLRQIAAALAAFHLLVAVFLLPAGDAATALLRAALVTVAIVVASAMKYHHSGMKLTVADFSLLRAGTLRFLLQQYRRTAVAALALATLFAILMLAPVAFDAASVVSQPVSLALRFGFLITAATVCALIYGTGDRITHFRSSISEPAHYFSSFVASVFDVRSWWRTDGLVFVDIAPQSLPLSAPVPARDRGRDPRRPDIIVIQHESVFDPRLFGLPIEPWLERFLAPPDAMHGRLHVEIFGGGSWQTEYHGDQEVMPVGQRHELRLVKPPAAASGKSAKHARVKAAIGTGLHCASSDDCGPSSDRFGGSSDDFRTSSLD